MDDKQLDELIMSLLQNERISKVIKDLSLDREKVIEALPIMIDMNAETEDGKREYFTSIGLNSLGDVQRIKTLTNHGKEMAYLNNVISNNITKINFEDEKKFIKSKSKLPIVNAFGKILEEKEHRGIYVYGKMGVGKTFMLKRFAKKLAQQDKTVAFLNIADLLSKYSDTFNSVETNKASGAFKNEFKKVDVLFIDDIGAESIYSWFREGFLFDVLNHRMENQMLTFFSSNYPMKELQKIEAKTEKKYKDDIKAARLLERIKALCIEFELEGNNKRY